MNNTYKALLVIAIFIVLRISYAFFTRASQKEVVSYVDAIDACLTNAEKQYTNLEIKVYNNSTQQQAGDSCVAKWNEVLDSYKESINTVDVPANDKLLNAIKEKALAHLELSRVEVKKTWTELVHKLYPLRKDLPYDIDLANLYITGRLTVKNEHANDSINEVIFDRKFKLNEKLQKDKEEYQSAVAEAYKSYKIIRINGL